MTEYERYRIMLRSSHGHGMYRVQRSVLRSFLCWKWWSRWSFLMSWADAPKQYGSISQAEGAIREDRQARQHGREGWRVV
jgi:hypothetical protein